MFIVNGEAEITMTSNGQETVIDRVGPGTSIGSYSVINGDPYTLGVKSVFDTNVLILEGSVLDDLRDNYSDLDHYLMEYEI